jgi:hypothetical protein
MLTAFDMRRMNKRLASTPTFTATTNPLNTVNTKVNTNIPTSARRRLQHMGKPVCIAHIPGHIEQDRRQGGERNMGRPGCEQQDHE